MIIVGITGCIGTGKTYLANIIQSIGFNVYNPDTWTHELYQKPQFLSIIKQNFENCYINNVFNKRALRNIVFNDNKQLKKLESIIHPFLNQKLKEIIRKNALKQEIIFLDVALLLEFGWDNYCDYVIVTDASPQVQKKRVMLRDNLSEVDFAKIMAVQMPQFIKKSYADIIIDTEKPQNLLKVQILKFIKEILL